MKIATVVLMLVSFAAVNAAQADKGAYPTDYKPPLSYGKDIVGVTPDGTLSVRCRAWNDMWGRNIASYLDDAKQAAAARSDPPRRVTFAAVLLKNVDITCPNHPGGDGKPMHGTFTTTPEQEKQIRAEAQKTIDFFYAASNGKLLVEFIFPVLDGLKVQAGDKAIFSIWPRGIQDQLLPALEKYKDANVAMWVFICSRPVTLNPPAGGKGIGVGPYGVCYTAWPLYGGYCMTTTAAAAGLWVHEFNHRYLDGLKNLEGIHLTKFHGLGLLGYAPGHNLDEAYFNTWLHIIRPAIYDRLDIATPNHTPLEPFTGKAYDWLQVRDDCWFKLPELHNAELAKLTGLDSFQIDTGYGGHARLFKVAPADRAKVLSPYIEPPVPAKPVKLKKGRDAAPPPAPSAEPLQEADATIPVKLDNFIATGKESCAAVRTATGCWLFVSANMADLYADMFKISGKPGKSLEIYGYVNEDTLPLLVFKAPADLLLPPCEEGFFRNVDGAAGK